MKYYTTSHYTGKAKQRRIVRIVLIGALVLGILIGLAVLGNILGDRLAHAQGILSLGAEDYTVQTGGAEPYVYDAPPAKKTFSAKVSCVPLHPGVLADPEAVSAAILSAFEAGQGVSVTVSDAIGLRFALSYMADNTALAPAAQLADAVGEAGIYPVHFSASVYTAHSAEQDAAVIEELSAMGVTETVLCGLSGSTLSEAQTYSLLVRLEMLRECAPQMTVGLALSPAVFTDAVSARYLHKLASYYDFLLLDLSEAETDGYTEYLEDQLRAHTGSLAYYDLAVLLDGKEDLSGAEELLARFGIEAVRCLY